MKIIFISGNLFSVGGIQRVVSLVASKLSLYHEILIISPSNEDSIERRVYELDSNIKIIDSKKIKVEADSTFRRKLKSLCNYSRTLSKLIPYKILKTIFYSKDMCENWIEFLNNQQADIVIGVDINYTMFLSVISRYLSSKTIGWEHNSFNAYFNTKHHYAWGKYKIAKNYLKNLNEIFVLTDSDVELYKSRMNLEVRRMYNPLSFNTEEKNNNDEKSIIFVGRLVIEQKGLDLLMNIITNVLGKREFSEWKVYILGDGPDKKYIQEIIYEKNLNGKVILLGETKNVIEYYLQSSILISTSRWEGFGLVITEAFECGLPVISFSTEGPKELIQDGINGFLIKNYDINEFIDKLILIMRDSVLRKQFSNNAIKRANDFSTDRIVDEWLLNINRVKKL